MDYKKVIALDLEMNKPSGKIIQIGAAVGDMATGQILESFGQVVAIDELVSEYIQTLTGITQERMLAEGIALQAAADGLFELAARHKTFMNPVVWGAGDAETLREQLGMNDKRWVFGRRSVDVKTIHVGRCLARGLSPKGGLSKTMMQHYGMKFAGRAHDARHDAENTLRLFFEMQRRYFHVTAGELA